MQPNRVVALASPNRVAAWAHPLGAAQTDRLIPRCSCSGVKGALATWAPCPNPSQGSEHQSFTEVPHGVCILAAERAEGGTSRRLGADVPQGVDTHPGGRSHPPGLGSEQLFLSWC